MPIGLTMVIGPILNLKQVLLQRCPCTGKERRIRRSYRWQAQKSEIGVHLGVRCDSVWPAMKRVILIILGVILGCVLGFCSFVLVTYWMGTITIDASQISIFPLDTYVTNEIHSIVN